MSVATRIRTERSIAAVNAVGALLVLLALMFLVGEQAYQFCMTAEQYSPFMGYVGVALPCMAVLFAFIAGFAYAKSEG